MAHLPKRKQSVTSPDVLIIGAGPGGSAAAIQCARAGLSVTLIEREEFPRERRGETLHPGVEPLLQQLGVFEEIVAAGFLRHEGNWVTWNGAPRFEPFGQDAHGPWRGYQAWRADFDLILLNSARQLGVRVIQPCRAEEPLSKAGRVQGAKTSEGSISSAFVVDAAGDRHWLARSLNLPIQKLTPPLTARFGYVEGDCPARDEAPAIVANASGWSWTARVRPTVYQWTQLSLSKEAQIPAEPPAEFRQLKPLGHAQGSDVTWRAVTPPAGAGYFLIGDAAVVLDPACSHGVLRAIMSGLLSANLIAGVLIHNTAPEQAALTYNRWMRDWWLSDVKRMRKIYSDLAKPPDWLPPDHHTHE
jgi:flavin-dependent dehydrogenase